MSQARRLPMTFEQFLEWERRQERKHEFIDGEVIARAGASEAHNIIQVNLLTASVPKLRGSACRPFPSDMLVHTGTQRGRYLDMTIDCGPRLSDNLIAPDPRVVFEILSQDSQHPDRTIKLADYNATRSTAHYVLIEQKAPLVDVYSRGPHGDFSLRPQEIRGLEGIVELPAIGISLTMAEIYGGLDDLDPIQDEANE